MDTNCVETALFGRVCNSCDGGAIYKILALIVKILSTGVGVLAVLGIIIGGVIYLTSSGDASRMAKAKKRITEVVLGLIVYGVMFTVLEFLIPGGVLNSTLDSSTTSCPTDQTVNPTSNSANANNNSSAANSNNNSSAANPASNANSSNQPTVHYDAKSNVVVNRSGLPYVLHVPEGATNNMPLVVFMHGQGEARNTNAVLNTPAVKAMNNTSQYPDSKKFIAISPVQPDDEFSASKVFTRTKSLIDEVVNTYQIDKNRIYIIGFSMGGSHTWCMVNQYPNLFKAAVPISMTTKYNCAGSGPTASNFKNTKIWAMAGGAESTNVRGMTNFVNEINSAGGSAKFSKVGNYAHENVQSNLDYSGIFSWLLSS